MHGQKNIKEKLLVTSLPILFKKQLILRNYLNVDNARLLFEQQIFLKIKIPHLLLLFLAPEKRVFYGFTQETKKKSFLPLGCVQIKPDLVMTTIFIQKKKLRNKHYSALHSASLKGKKSNYG